MPLTDTSTIILVVALVVVAALLVWLSLSMAAAESAVGRVTRAGLNNKILEVQTDTETSQFIRMKKIGKIHTVQRLIANRYATSGSCAFFRITCNVFDGVLVACVASLLDAPIWLQLLCGFLFALIVGIVSVLVRPRSAGASKPIDIMLNLAGLVRFATAITPFAKAGEQKGQKRRSKESDLSDDEELEKIQLEQGRATIDRLVEANDFDPEVSEMLRNVLTLSETLTREIMVPRTDMICMDRTATLADMLRLCSRSGFSRVPVIGDDVEIGAGTTVDRGALEDTVIGDGTKLDNQIQLGHNDRIGRHVVMAACVGIAGSTTVGDHCMVGGAAMINGHINIPAGSGIGPGTAITGWGKEPAQKTGFFPALEGRDFQLVGATISRLPAMRKELKALARRMAELEALIRSAEE